jgi:phage repressor protein C with HTH and peptisase S24 domain
MPARETTQADQVVAVIEEGGGKLRRAEILDQVDFSETRLDNLLSEMTSGEHPELEKAGRGVYTTASRSAEDENAPEEDEGDLNEALANEPDESYDESSISYVLTQAGAGPGRTSSNERMTVDKKLMRSELGRVPDKDEGFWVQIQGHSMEPWLADGQYVFALDQQVVDVPGRYVIWWGGHESEVCCYLAKLSEKTLLLRKYGPEKEFRLNHVEGDTYEIEDGTTVRLQVRGRIIWPPDRARSVMETVTDQIGQVMKEALSDL